MNWISNVLFGSSSSPPPAEQKDERFPADIAWYDNSPCHTCDAPCATHPVYPKLPRIEGGEMVGSVKPYKKHLIVLACGNPDSWPAKIEKGNDELFITKMAHISKSGALFEAAGGTVMVSASNIPRVSADSDATGDILLFPDFRVLQNVPVSISSDDLANLCAAFIKDPSSSEINGVTVAAFDKGQTAILICGHTKRDKRCGFAGKILSEEFAKQLASSNKDSNVVIGQISHIGGHKWAGNVVLYPSGDWYGRVTACDVDSIIQHHLGEGKVIKDLWRGRIGLGESQPKEEKEKEKEKDW